MRLTERLFDKGFLVSCTAVLILVCGGERGGINICNEDHWPGTFLQVPVARAAASSDMKKNVGGAKDGSAANPAALGIELDNDADPEATVITVSGQGQNTDLLSQMTGWPSACLGVGKVGRSGEMGGGGVEV